MNSLAQDARPTSTFPDIRRVITGHNIEGKSVTLKDDVVKPISWSLQNPSPIYDLYGTTETPAVTNSEVTSNGSFDIPRGSSFINPDGSTFGAIDLAPGQIMVCSEYLIPLVRGPTVLFFLASASHCDH